MSDNKAENEESEQQKAEAEKRALRNNRKAKLAQITRRKNIINELMKDNINANEVEENVLKYNELFDEFKAVHQDYQRLLEEDEIKDDELWYEPKRISIIQFRDEAAEWLTGQKNADKQERDDQDEISANDSVSVAKHKRTTVSQTSSELGRQAIADRAALEIKIAALKERHAIEEEEQELAKKQEHLRKQKEMLSLQSELEATNAKLAALKEEDVRSTASHGDGMNAYLDEALKQSLKEPIVRTDELKTPSSQGVDISFKEFSVRPKSHALPTQLVQLQASTGPARNTQPPNTYTLSMQEFCESFPERAPSQRTDQQAQRNTATDSTPIVQPSQDNAQLYNIIQKQNDITTSLLKQQDKSFLPRRELTVFNNDPLEYRAFIRSFEHLIESKVEHAKDKLLFRTVYLRSIERAGKNLSFSRAKQRLCESQRIA